MPRITQRYGREAYEFRENSIVVTIPFNWINVMSDTVSSKVSNKTGNKTGDKTAGEKTDDTDLSKMQVRILAEIRNDPNITRSRIMEKLKVGKTSVDTGISVLKKLGYIERVGSKKTGYWNVLK